MIITVIKANVKPTKKARKWKKKPRTIVEDLSRTKSKRQQNVLGISSTTPHSSLSQKFMYCLFICLCSATLLLKETSTWGSGFPPASRQFLMQIYTPLQAAIIHIPEKYIWFQRLLSTLRYVSCLCFFSSFSSFAPRCCRLVTCRHHYHTYQNYLYKKCICIYIVYKPSNCKQQWRRWHKRNESQMLFRTP